MFYSVTQIMEINGLRVTFNLPKALEIKRDGVGLEMAQVLPPYAPQDTYLVDEYPACPDSWYRSTDMLKSHFVPVKVEEGQKYGMWLDFNSNFGLPYDVAVVVSIQGINPETGQPIEDLRLEQYKHNCPVHSMPFGADRYCAQCGWQWPPQNYLSTTAYPLGMLWIDGFRASNGVKRQYVFTLDEMKGVAAQIIGEARAFAIGIAFFLSKEKKKIEPLPELRWPTAPITKPRLPGIKLSKFPDDDFLHYLKGADKVIEEFSDTREISSFQGGEDAPKPLENSLSKMRLKRVEVGAGAMISQKNYLDPQPLSYWQETEAGRIVINYVLAKEAEEIIAAGKKDLNAGGEGYLSKVNLAV